MLKTQEQYENLFHNYIELLTGIDPKLIRPMKTTEGTRVAKADASGSLEAEDTWADFYVFLDEDQDEPRTLPDGQSVESRRTIRLEANFYGRDSQNLAKQFSMLQYTPIAHEYLGKNKMSILDGPGIILKTDDLRYGQWWLRSNISVTINELVTIDLPTKAPSEVDSIGIVIEDI